MNRASENEIQSKVETFISELIFRPLNANENLVTDRLIDSIALVELVVFIESSFSVKIAPHEMTAENFDHPTLISRLILEKQSAQGVRS